MTGGVNGEGGRRILLNNCLGCARAPPHIYRWEGEGRGQEEPQLGLNPTWAPPKPHPLPYMPEGEGKRRGRKGRGRPNPPLSFLPSPPSFSSYSAYMGAHQPLVAGAFPLFAHKAYIFCRGCPEPLSVTRYVPGTLWNTSGVRILSSYISIFTSQPFRDSLSCP